MSAYFRVEYFERGNGYELFLFSYGKCSCGYSHILYLQVA